MIEAVFIGGPYDCKIMTVADDVWRMEYVVAGASVLEFDPDAEVSIVPREHRHYQREHWTDGQRHVVVYVEEGVDRENATVVALADELFEIQKLGSERTLDCLAKHTARTLPFWVWPDDRKPCRRLAVYHHRFLRRLGRWKWRHLGKTTV